MCNCKQRILWSVLAIEDEDAMAMGYDGDIDDDTDTSDWHAYLLIVQKRCSRCDAVETHDSMGSVWVTPADLTSDVLRNTVICYDMVPKNVRDWDISDYLA